jgi:hypothetical protein
MKSIIIENEQRRTYLSNLIQEQPVDGSVTVEIKKTDRSPTAAQTRTMWMWNGEIAKSGLGQDDVAEDVHTRMKGKFAIPILLRENVFFGKIYAAFYQKVQEEPKKTRPEMWWEFARDYVSTTNKMMTRNQRAEYMADVFDYWVSKGVELTDPTLQGLNMSFGSDL